MADLSSPALSALIGAIYACALDSSQWRKTLERLAGAFEANRAGLVISAPAQNVMAVASTGPDSALINSYNGYYGRLDPIAAAIARAPAGAILTNGDILSRAAARRHEFFNDWAFPNACGDCISARLLDGEAGTSWLCVATSLADEPFGTPERLALMRLVAPHVERAVQVQLKLDGLAAERDQMLHVLEGFGHGVVLAGQDGRVVFANAAAIEVFEKRDGLSVRTGGYLHAAFADEDAALAQAIAGASLGGVNAIRSGGSLAVTRPSVRRPFAVHVLPLGEPFDGFPRQRPAAMVLIIDPEREHEPPLQLWRRCYGLTNAEAQVAAGVLRGEGLQAVADALALSLSTVRVHLQRAFEKTGTRRQAALVRALLAVGRGADLLRQEEERRGAKAGP